MLGVLEYIGSHAGPLKMNQTETAAEGEKAKYLSALKSTVASVPAGEHFFVLTRANVMNGKRGGGEIDNKALGAYGRDVLNKNSKLLLRFTEDNELALLNTLFCAPKIGVSYMFQSPNRGKTGGLPTGPLR